MKCCHESNLENCEKGNVEGVEIGWWSSFGEVESPSEKLHSQQGKYEDEQEEEKQQGQDGTHRAEQGYHQVAK